MNRQNMFDFLSDPIPSNVLWRLRLEDQLDYEIDRLIDVPQDHVHHPEGDAFVHTCMVVDQAAIIAKRERLSNLNSALLRLGALTHDFGKPDTTVIHPDGRITAFGHPEAGVLPAFDFLHRSGIEKRYIPLVQTMIREHMVHIGFNTPDITARTVRRIIQRIAPLSIKMLALLVEADLKGRGVFHPESLARMDEIVHVANNLDTIHRPDPIISGDVIMRVLNITPSKRLGLIKKELYDLQLSGKITSEAEGIQYLLLNYM